MKRIVRLLFALAVVVLPVKAFAATEIIQTDFDNAKSDNAETKALATAKGITYSTGEYTNSYNLESGEYVFGGNITTDANIVIASGKTVTLDLNSKTLEGTIESGGTLTVSNGTITPSYLALQITGGTLTAENITTSGSVNVENATATFKSGTYASVYFQMNSIGTISGGTFGGTNQYSAVGYTAAKKLTITGGTFTGITSGMQISVSGGTPDISISGGTFKAVGSTDVSAEGAIIALLFDGSKTYDFTNVLASGYKFSTDVASKAKDGESPGEIIAYLDSNEVKVVAGSSSNSGKVTNASVTDAKDVADATKDAIAEAAKEGKATTGIDADTAAAIKEAVDAGQTVTSALIATPLTANDLTEDAKAKINEAKSAGATILGYFDVQVQVLADGTTIGNITELKNKLKVTLDTREMIASLPAVAKGKKRIFKAVTIHNGKTKVLDLTVNADNTSSFENDEFSDYVITYEDVDDTANPNTLDNISLYMMLAIGSLGIMTILFLNRKRFN